MIMKKIFLFIALATSLLFSSCSKEKSEYAFSYSEDLDIACARDMSVSADFLYMNAFEEGMEYGIILDSEFANVLQQKFNPGFRVAFQADFDFKSSDFTLDLDWSYIRIKRDFATIKDRNIIAGTFLPPDVVLNRMSSASARHTGDFSTFDINLVKPYHPGRYFVSKPSIGVRVAWIDQDYYVRYNICIYSAKS